MLWMTVYLWNSGDRAKSIEAEWCANALWWWLTNFVFYTPTSRNLRFQDRPTEKPISPSYYYIQLTWWTATPWTGCIPQNALSWYLCNEIILWYATGYFISWHYNPDQNIQEYKTLTASNTCRHGNARLWFYRSWWQFSWNIDYIRMNKWFTPREVKAERVFFLHDLDWVWKGEDKEKLLIWDIIVVRCPESSCKWRKQIGKRHVDARSQTISFKKCRYYDDTWNICKTREDCVLYDTDDPTICRKY